MLLAGDLVMIIALLLVLVNQAKEHGFGVLKFNVGALVIGILAYLSLAYYLGFYTFDKISKGKYSPSLANILKTFSVFTVFVLILWLFDNSFRRIPWGYIFLSTPVIIGLWRYFFGNLFGIAPQTRNVLYLYDDNITSIKEDIHAIQGRELKTNYKVKHSYSIDDVALSASGLLATENRTPTWIVNTNSRSIVPDTIEREIFSAISRGKDIIYFNTFYENTYEALPINSYDNFHEILQINNTKIGLPHKIFSFAVNFNLSVLVGLVCVLATPFVFTGNLFFNKGPLFYVQKRVGRYGKEFKIYKFRSMVTDAEKAGAKMATKNDSRITPFGRILRTFRIDELPQIISVIKGDMKFIGPRPERKVFVSQLNQMLPFYNVRHLIPPGITGWAQVKYKYGENMEDSMRKLEYDLYYIKNRSITLDLRIIFKTITTVLFSKGV